MSKKDLRSLMLQKRQELAAGEVAFRSKRIFENFQSLHQSILKNIPFKTIGLYFPVRGEVDTRAFSDFLKSEKKQIAFPRVDSTDMSFRLVNDWHELKVASFGIAVPSDSAKPIAPEIILVPGLVYDQKGYRVGYGQGYFDRYLAQSSGKVVCVALAYDFQLVDSIHPEAHDMRMSYIVTESSTLAFNE